MLTYRQRRPARCVGIAPSPSPSTITSTSTSTITSTITSTGLPPGPSSAPDGCAPWTTLQFSHRRFLPTSAWTNQSSCVGYTPTPPSHPSLRISSSTTRGSSASSLPGDDAEVARVPEGVLAVRRHVVTLLAEHLVELPAAVSADDLDARSRVLLGERAQQAEQAIIERVDLAGRPVGDERVEARLRGRLGVEREELAGVHLIEGREERRVVVDVDGGSLPLGQPPAVQDRTLGTGRIRSQSRRRHRGEKHGGGLRVQAHAFIVAAGRQRSRVGVPWPA